MLAPIGLSELAEQVYLAMLASPDSDLPRLAADLGRSVDDIRPALDELIDLALVTRAADGDTLRAVGPTVGLASLMAEAEAEVAERQRQIEATRAAISAISAAHDEARDREQTTKLDGVDAVRARIEELCAHTTTECVSLNPGASQTPDAKTASRLVNQRMLERGVAIRCVYQDSHRYNPLLLEYAEWLTRQGGEIRTAPTVPMLLIVFDSRIALLPIDPTDSRRGAHEVHSPGLVGAAYALFGQVWTTATPTSAPARRDDDGLDPQLRELIRMLAAGHTDEMAARKLGLSTRTVKRKSAELMEKLHARSRFQAGVYAAQRGWVDQSPTTAPRRDIRPVTSRAAG